MQFMYADDIVLISITAGLDNIMMIWIFFYICCLTNKLNFVLLRVIESTIMYFAQGIKNSYLLCFTVENNYMALQYIKTRVGSFRYLGLELNKLRIKN